MKTKLLLLCVAVLLLRPPHANAQIWQIEPREPRWGDKVRFELEPPAAADPQAVAAMGLAVATLDEDGGESVQRPPIRWVEGRRIAELTIPEGLAYLTVHTLDDSPRNFMTLSKIYRPDGRPARGAWERELFTAVSGHDEVFAREMELYPENYSAYRSLWWVKSALFKEEFSAQLLRQQMEELRQRDPQRSDEWLYAMSYGYLLLGEEEESRRLIHELIERFPMSPLVTSTFKDYHYQAQVQDFGAPQQEALKRLLLEHLARFPELESGGELLLGFDSARIAPSTARAVYAAWSRAEPGNAWPHVGLAMVYRSHGERLEEGMASALRAVDLALRGEMLPYGDLDGSWIPMYLPMVYLEAARLADALDRSGEALAFAIAAQELATEPDTMPYEFEGELWESLEQSDLAEKAYRAAWRWGSSTAEHSLTRLHRTRGGTAAELETYLEELRASHPGQRNPTDGTAEADEEKQLAPDFTVTSLSGESYALHDLRGKVVVLNFWNTGCLPCRAEMPHLNRMVERFADRDVLFLAPTTDSPAILRKFLADRDFAYKVVPESEELRVRYGVDAIPVHVVIGRGGSLLFRRTGFDERKLGELARVIESAL